METQKKLKTYSAEERSQVANEILKQLGGNKFVVMCGVSKMRTLEPSRLGIKMNIPTNKSKANRFTVEYISSLDLYELIFSSEWFDSKEFKLKVNIKVCLPGISCDQLTEVFERVTGFYTKLF